MIMDRGLIYAELLRLRNEYREYREKHWDTERNHILPEFAEGLYRIFRDGIIMRKAWDWLNRETSATPKPRVIETHFYFL